MTEKTGMRRSEYRILGITGGVGAGKSTVLSYLKERYGACLLEADRIGHQVQQPGEPCFDQIVAAFGKEILQDGGAIDRRRLGNIVYADREKMVRLNQIVHPAVKERIRREIDRICRENVRNLDETAGIQKKSPAETAGNPKEPFAESKARNEICGHRKQARDTDISVPFVLIVIEAALLLEDHYDEICDEVWYIYADEQTREERLVQSRGYSREKVRQILSNQMSEEEFRLRCPVVIDNSGSDLNDTYTQIDQALCMLRNAQQDG
ncbi:MAG: dephospho-CoA kinase [Lachnospiraceae bacterium]|nr:dephospho-CoA kinase [Lachnospiraceae bacterium]